MNGKQRYKCKECGYNFTEDDRRKIPDGIKKLAVRMYLEGLGFSPTTILKIFPVASRLRFSFFGATNVPGDFFAESTRQ